MFAVRSYMLDISRDKVPTMGTLKQLVDILARFDYNQFQLYTEHTFAYAAHKAVWEKASPLTAEEIRELDLYCVMHGIELVPNQNCFGHMERWLTKPDYNHLAELPKGVHWRFDVTPIECFGKKGRAIRSDGAFGAKA